MTREEAWLCVMGDRSPMEVARDFDLTDADDERGIDEWVGGAEEDAIRECPKRTDGDLLGQEEFRAALWPHAEWLRAQLTEGIQLVDAERGEMKKEKEELPKRVVIWASAQPKCVLEVPPHVTTENELEAWACEASEALLESGWYPLEPGEELEER